MVVDPGRLTSFVAGALEAVDMPEPDARVAAQAMVGTDLRGQHTHGVWFLNRYVDGLRGGGIRARAVPRVISETAGTAVLDGDGGLGAVVALRACELAAAKAEATGCATVLVRNSNHFGAAGYYTAWLAEHGCLGLITANATPTVAAPGARARMIGTQPLSMAAPDPDGQGVVVLDIALSVTAGTRLAQARSAGESVPLGWAVDSEGRPTTDPNRFFEGGALQPLGGHKGYGLGIFMEILAGVLSGSAVTHEVRSHDATRPSGTGHCVMALKVDAFMAAADFKARLATLREEIHSAPTAAGASQPMLPGEPESRHLEEAGKSGLELEAPIWGVLCGVADQLGRRVELEGTRKPLL